MRRLAFVALLCLMSVTGMDGSILSSLGWKAMNARIRSEFPKVKRITTAELAAWLNDQKRPTPLLLDVRTPAEYNVSHLKGAQRINPDAKAPFDLPRDRPIVTYCSVGYRSAALAKRLREAGYQTLENLEGSIFQWANEERPVYRDGEPVSKVHPYNGIWGKLLAPAHRADVPAVKP